MKEYKVGDKFIIEIGDIFESEVDACEKLYKIKGFNSLVFDNNGLSKIEEYDEISHRLELIEELKTDEYNRGCQNSWSLSHLIRRMTLDELGDCFGVRSNDRDIVINRIFDKYSYKEAFNKFTEYTKKKNNFEIGDVVENKSSEVQLLVTSTNSDGTFDGVKITPDDSFGNFGSAYSGRSTNDYNKLGAYIHFKKMFENIKN